jgi:hypothetical protein
MGHLVGRLGGKPSLQDLTFLPDCFLGDNCYVGMLSRSNVVVMAARCRRDFTSMS